MLLKGSDVPKIKHQKSKNDQEMSITKTMEKKSLLNQQKP